MPGKEATMAEELGAAPAGGGGEAEAGAAALPSSGTEGASPPEGGAPAPSGYHGWYDGLPEEHRTSGAGYREAMNRRDSKITDLESKVGEFEGRPDPYADVLAWGRRLFPDEDDAEHRRIIQAHGVRGYVDIMRKEEERTRTSREGPDADPNGRGDARMKALEARLDKYDESQKSRADQQRELTAFEDALDAQGIKDPDDREALWNLAAAHRDRQLKFGKRVTEAQAVKDMMDSRTKRDTAQRELWKKEAEEKASGEKAGLPAVAASKEPPSAKEKEPPSTGDTEEAAFMAKIEAKADRLSG